MDKEILRCNVPYILNGEFYEIIALDGENVTVRCCHCASRNIYKGSIRSTGNFHMHIKRKHPILLPRVQEVKLNSFLNRKFVPRKRSIGKIGQSKRREGDHDSNAAVGFTTEPSQTCLPQTLEQSRDLPTPTMAPRNQPPFSVEGEVKTEEEINLEEISEKSYNASKEPSPRPPADGEKNGGKVTTDKQIPQWEEALSRIEDQIKGIERELRLRNQIETNRLFLELAKFKYLHPHFSFST